MHRYIDPDEKQPHARTPTAYCTSKKQMRIPPKMSRARVIINIQYLMYAQLVFIFQCDICQFIFSIAVSFSRSFFLFLLFAFRAYFNTCCLIRPLCVSLSLSLCFSPALSISRCRFCCCRRTFSHIDYCFIFYVLHRLIAAAPCIREQFWSLSKYVLGQLNVIIKSRGRQMSDNSAYKISRSINNKQNPKHVLSHCSSKIDVFHNNQDG